MATYLMHRSGGSCPAELTGANIIEAIEHNFDVIAREAGVGNAAGYKLLRVQSAYRQGILGGKGGVEVTIEATGMPLAHTGNTDPHKTVAVWIEAKPGDLPVPHTHDLA